MNHIKQKFKMIFFNIGWMNNYRGLTSDTIVGGGSFVAEKGYGHEMFNFLPESGKLYGYVQPVRPHDTINIDRIGASESDDYIDDVLVVWVSRFPKIGGVYVVGWYENARVYRKQQIPASNCKRKYKGEIFGYYVEADEQYCTLLPIDERTLRIPQKKGGMGQSNVWYADKDENLEFKREILEFIRNQDVRTNRTGKKSFPRQPDLYKRQQVEEAAIRETDRYYRDIGYNVVSVEKDNVGWDLEASIEGRKLLIEVKGLSGDQICVELTPNEYSKMQTNKHIYRLSILTNALSNDPNLYIFSYSPENSIWEDNRGNHLKINKVISARMGI